MNSSSKNPRREFLGKLATGAGTTLALPALFSSLNSEGAVDTGSPAQADEWFKKIKGKHRIVYDATEPNNGFPVIWSWVFYKSNNETGSTDSELTALVVFRHHGICLAMEDRIWEKYKFGEMFKVTDGTTNAPAIKNPYNLPIDPRMVAMGMDGIKMLTSRGVMFCVCDIALTVMAGTAAKALNLSPEDVKRDWLSGLLSGVQVVPSGVWAIGRAQENKCAYCYAGGN